MNDGVGGEDLLGFPAFIMSIDTEMLWGPTSPRGRALLAGRGDEDREAIAALLGMLNKHGIGATWAVVGHLFQDRCDEATCLTARNMAVHGYRPEWYRDPYSDRHHEPLYYGTDIVESLLSAGDQEIGYHSYSHPLFTDIPREMAEEELAQAREIGQQWGIEMRSFVFPQDRVAHADLLPRYGFTIFRGGLARRRRDLPPLRRKINGAINKVVADPVRPVERGGVWEVPGSMPFSDTQLPSSVQLRARLGVERAIRTNRTFHVYLHPWDLLLYGRLMNDLDSFLGFVDSKRDEGRIRVMTMGQYAGSLSEASEVKAGKGHGGASAP